VQINSTGGRLLFPRLIDNDKAIFGARDCTTHTDQVAFLINQDNL